MFSPFPTLSIVVTNIHTHSAAYLLGAVERFRFLAAICGTVDRSIVVAVESLPVLAFYYILLLHYYR